MGVDAFDKNAWMPYPSVPFRERAMDVRGEQRPEKGSLESCHLSKDLREAMV